MWLSRIELKNFKSYRQQIFQFPQPGDGKNIVLIGGVNGFGKTTLLEAIYVGLYGEEAVNHRALDRAGLKAKSYGHFLETAFYRGALQEGQERMEVLIEFSRDDGSALSVNRKWFFSGGRKFSSQNLVIKQKTRNGDWVVRPESSLPDLLNGYATPPWLAPFFFFDGEKIAELADADREGWITSGLESLLGVVLVKELRQQLTAYIDKKNRESGGVDEQKVDELRGKLETEQNKASSLIEKIEEQSRALASARQTREGLITSLSSLAQGNSARTVAEVAEALSRAEQQEEQSWKRLRELSSGPLALQLIRRDLYSSLEKTLSSEAALTEWEHGKKQLQPRWEQFRDTFFDSEWLCVISQLPGARESLEKTLAVAWGSLFNPRPVECAEAIWHDYLQAHERRKLSDLNQRANLSASVLRKSVDTHANADKEKRRLQQELIQLEGAGDNGAEIRRLAQELEECQTTLAEMERAIGGNENEQRALSAEISALTATYERERKKLVEGHPERRAAREADRVVDVIDDLLPKLFDLKLASLSRSATRIFRSLHQKDQVEQILIGSDGKTRLFSKEGTEITLPKSSGESQLFVLALVGALAEVTGYTVPLIVDTPLARLSEKHCTNLLNYWSTDTNRQVILLAQDKEIGAKEYNNLRPNVAKTYLLKHQQIGHGIGKTEAVADAYFGDL